MRFENTDEAKKYLRDLIFRDRRIQSKVDYVSRLREMATRSTSRTDAERFGGTNRRSKVEDAVCKLIDAEREIDDAVDRLVDSKREVQRIIDRMADEREKLVLEMRYFNLASWEEIQDCLHCERTWAYRIHGDALINFVYISQRVDESGRSSVV